MNKRLIATLALSSASLLVAGPALAGPGDNRNNCPRNPEGSAVHPVQTAGLKGQTVPGTAYKTNGKEVYVVADEGDQQLAVGITGDSYSGGNAEVGGTEVGGTGTGDGEVHVTATSPGGGNTGQQDTACFGTHKLD